MKVLVIMPTYNEVLNLQHSVEELFNYNPDVNLLIVDDQSPDGTGRLADELSASNPAISVLHRTGKNGLANAYKAGFAWGLERGFENLVEMDADGSHRAEDLPALLAEAPGSELVIGSRWIAGGKVENWAWHRVMLSKWGNKYAKFMLHSAVSDLTAGFRVYQAGLLRRLKLDDLSARGYSFQVEMTRKSEEALAVITEVPITFIEREYGVSKMSRSIVLEAMWLVTKLGLRRIFKPKRVGANL
jgi:glycosyltransferase involved in cell wall biosynthesis